MNTDTKLQPVLLDRANDLSAFCSKDATRFVLQGIHVNGCTEACDGRILIRVPFAPIPVSEFPPVNATNERIDCIIPCKPLSEAVNKAKGMTLPVLNTVRLSTRETPQGSKAQLVTTDLENERAIETKIIDGNYPNTDQVIPNAEPTLTICLSAHYLRTLADYAEKHGKPTKDGQDASVCLSFNTELDPVRFRITLADSRQATGVLMPMRSEPCVVPTA